jgi:hypothetical protein
MGREAADLHKFPNAVDRRESGCGCEVHNLFSMINGERVFDRNQGVQVLSSCRFKCAIELTMASHLQGSKRDPQRSGRALRLFGSASGRFSSSIVAERFMRARLQVFFRKYQVRLVESAPSAHRIRSESFASVAAKLLRHRELGEMCHRRQMGNYRLTILPTAQERSNEPHDGWTQSTVPT